MAISTDSEDFTGKSRLVANVLTSWLSQVLVIIAGFFLPRAIDNNLGQAGLGIWDFAWSITSYLSLSQLGIGAALNRYIARYRTAGDTQSLVTAVSTTISIQCAIASLVSIACLCLYFAVPHFFGNELGDSTEAARWVAVLLGLSVATDLLFDTSRGILTGCHRWDIFNAVNSITHLASTFAMIALLMGGYGLIEIAAMYLLFAVVRGIVRAYYARRVCPEGVFQRNSVSLGFGREIVKFGLRSITINMSPLVIQQSLYIAVVSTLGPAALAVLARPLALTSYIATFITRFTFVLTPMVESVQSIEGDERLRSFSKEAARYELAFVVPPVVLFALFGSEIIALWMGPDYVNQTLVWIFSISTVLTMSQSSLLRIIIGLDRHAEAARIAILATILLVLSSIAFGYRYELYSIEYFAAAIAASNVLVFGIYVPVYSCRVLAIKISEYLKAILPTPTIVALVTGGGLLLLQEYLQLEMLTLIGAAAIYISIVAIAYYAFLVPIEFKRQMFERLGWA